MTTLPDTLSAIADLSVPFAPPPASLLAGLSDDALLGGQRRAAELGRRVAALSAAFAGEIAHRSRRELGHDGLAQRLGQRTAENLVQRVTGASGPEARSLVSVGALLPVDLPRPDAAPQPSWLVAVGAALAAGTLSVLAVEAIRTGLGGESEAVSAGDLAVAAATLLREAPGLTLEQLGARARELRTDLDLAGVRDREAALHDKRYLRFTKLPDGMTRVHGLLDPESAAIVVPVFDAITSPRRGGPRFVDPEARDRAENLVRDPRSTEQITLDNLVELVRIAAAVDDGTVLGTNRPTVSLLLTHRDLAAGSGVAFFAGQAEGVSLQSAERHFCNADIIPMLFTDDGQPLSLGRTRRRFNRAQRRALAARDGGCRFPGCTMPPSWTEAHHILQWLRDAGLTDIDNGILLCRFHHLLVHNNGWAIIREGGEFYFVPPPDVDPQRRRIPAPSKSPPLRRLLSTA